MEVRQQSLMVWQSKAELDPFPQNEGRPLEGPNSISISIMMEYMDLFAQLQCM